MHLILYYLAVIPLVLLITGMRIRWKRKQQMLPSSYRRLGGLGAHLALPPARCEVRGLTDEVELPCRVCHTPVKVTELAAFNAFADIRCPLHERPPPTSIPSDGTPCSH